MSYSFTHLQKARLLIYLSPDIYSWSGVRHQLILSFIPFCSKAFSKCPLRDILSVFPNSGLRPPEKKCRERSDNFGFWILSKDKESITSVFSGLILSLLAELDLSAICVQRNDFEESLQKILFHSTDFLNLFLFFFFCATWDVLYHPQDLFCLLFSFFFFLR